MVYRGPSRGCETCRKRRVKCDEKRPSCGNCVKRKQECPGYRNLFDAIHKDETQTTTVKAHARKTSARVPNDTISESSYDSNDEIVRYNSDDESTVLEPLKMDLEMDSLCFFFANYVNIPRDQHSNIYIEHILPLYIEAAPQSPLKLATAAAAIIINSMWHQRGMDPKEARAAYVGSVQGLRECLADPKSAQSDEVLCAIFMLDFVDNLKRRFVNDPDRDTHQKGAMALIQQRGTGSSTRTSNRLFSALRNRYIQFCVQSKRRMEFDDGFLELGSEQYLPAPRHDVILAAFANLQYDARQLVDFEPNPSIPESPIDSTSFDKTITYEEIIQRAIDLDTSLHAWVRTLPQTWLPYRIPDTNTIHQSIHSAGIYNNLCDVYVSLCAVHIQNQERTTHILVLQLIKHCLLRLPTTSPYKYLITTAELDTQIQTLVDDICASVPFHLGSRTDLSLPDEQHHHYPPIPPAFREQADYFDQFEQKTTMTEQDHSRSASAIGGWFLLIPLSTMLKLSEPQIPGMSTGNSPASTNADGSEHGQLTRKIERLRLRPGQWFWIMQQVKRCQRLYLIAPIPPSLPTR